MLISTYHFVPRGLLYNNESGIIASLWINIVLYLLSLCTHFISIKGVHLSTLNLLHYFCAITQGLIFLFMMQKTIILNVQKQC